MAGLFGSITIKGNRLTDFAAQTATVGIPMPFGFGKFPVEGNVIFAPMPPKEHVKKKKQGKGGVKTEEYSYTLSYAIAFCEGPIFGYWTIKRNGKIVWTQDPAASVEDKAYAAKWAQKATFYLGTETQLPDSTIESYKGAGQVSAHRGVAYIVVEDDDVTDNGGAVPTYEAVVVASAPDVYLTSRPYNMYAEDGLAAAWNGRNGITVSATIDEMQISSLTMLDGLHREVIQKYTLSDSMDESFTMLDGQLKSVLRPYAMQAEPIDISTLVMLNGTLVETLKRYQNYPPEPLDFTFSMQPGTLT